MRLATVHSMSLFAAPTKQLEKKSQLVNECIEPLSPKKCVH